MCNQLPNSFKLILEIKIRIGLSLPELHRHFYRNKLLPTTVV